MKVSKNDIIVGIKSNNKQGLLKADDPNYAIDPLLHSGRMCPMCIAATENAHRADTSS